jgi:hypothetical protein
MEDRNPRRKNEIQLQGEKFKVNREVSSGSLPYIYAPETNVPTHERSHSY